MTAPNSGNTSPLEAHVERIRELAKEGSTVADVARAFKVSHAAVRRLRDRHGILFGKSGGDVEAPAAKSVTSVVPEEWGDIEALIRARGLNPDDWIVSRARVNEWGDPAGPLAQLRVDLEPRMGLLMPARSEGWIAPPKSKSKAPKVSGSAELVAFFGDHHAPRHDEHLHALTCEWLRAHKPDRGIILGDLVNLAAVSRHRRVPEKAESLQQSIDAGYSILRGYVQASPDTRWQLLAGNHEDRLRNAVIDVLPSSHGLRRGGADDEHPVQSIPFLLRLDELGVEWTDPAGPYEHAQVKVTPELAARHGWIASKGSGSSALRTVDHLRHSVVIGHTHRQSVVHHTSHSIDGEPRTLLGCEAGTLAQIEGGLSYAVSPDWQQGFATATCWPDGRFKLDLATYTAGSLMWRDWRAS